MNIRNKTGFTLIEAILTISILAAGFMGVFTLFQQNVSKSDEMEQTAIATNMAQEMLEQMIQDKAFQGYDYVTSSNYTSPEVLTDYGYPDYTRTIDIGEVSSADLTTPSVGSGFKKITVSVSVTGGPTISLVTLVTNWSPGG